MKIIYNNIKRDINIPEADAVSCAVRKIKKLGIKVFSAKIYKKSIDAREKNKDRIYFIYSVLLCIEDISENVFAGHRNITIKKEAQLSVQSGSKSLPVSSPIVITGFGPCGMFAALILAENGYKPLVIERGNDIDTRTADVDAFWKKAKLNTNSNVQFGEGGAGTFSDGKLTTRINDPLCEYVLSTFVKFGAPEEILYSAKPHIGTDKLKTIVKNIREEIIRLGGEVRFNTCMQDIRISNGRLSKIITNNDVIDAGVMILAPGHSARDTYRMLAKNNIQMTPKSFSVGFRAEHLQTDIDFALYGKFAGNPKLGRASYTLSHKTENHGIYSFCMCPGGSVVAAASEENSVVVNGMSLYARDNANANSAIVSDVSNKDFGNDLFSGMEFQRRLEKNAFELGGCDYSAPVQRISDYINNTASVSFGKVLPSYTGNTRFADLNLLFNSDINNALKEGLLNFDRKIKGFCNENAIITGIETRTSAPLRILRGTDRQSIGVSGLYPSGEGAGYAGGIMSAAVDGIKTALKIIEEYKI